MCYERSASGRNRGQRLVRTRAVSTYLQHHAGYYIWGILPPKSTVIHISLSILAVSSTRERRDFRVLLLAAPENYSGRFCCSDSAKYLPSTLTHCSPGQGADSQKKRRGRGVLTPLCSVSLARNTANIHSTQHIN